MINITGSLRRGGLAVGPAHLEHRGSRQIPRLSNTPPPTHAVILGRHSTRQTALLHLGRLDYAMGSLIDLTGLKFGTWKVLYRVPSSSPPMWMCRCVCGTTREVSGSNLRSGLSTNCGCQRQYKIVHGHSTRREGRTPTYSAWRGMHSRCHPEAREAADYHDRGIKVCAEWADYTAFLEDMGECPPKHRLDRIDLNRGFEPGNCRWTLPGVQRRNGNRINTIHYADGPHCLKDAAALIGVSDTVVYMERSRNGGSYQEAFERVLARQRRRTSTTS